MKKNLTYILLLFVLLSYNTYSQSVDQFLETNNDLIEAKGKWKAILVYSDNGKLLRGNYFLLETHEKGLIFLKKRNLHFKWRSPNKNLLAIEWKDLRSLSFQDLSKKGGRVASTAIIGGLLGAVVGVAVTSDSGLGEDFAAFFGTAAGGSIGIITGIAIGSAVKTKAEEYYYDVSANFNELQLGLIKYEMIRRYRE